MFEIILYFNKRMRPIRLEREKEALDCNYTTEQNPTSPNNKIDIISCKLKLVVQ